MVLDFGDIPSGSLHLGSATHASVASNGAAATYGNAGANKLRAPCACEIVGAYWEAIGADNDATNTASYRQLSVVNGGQAAAGTTVLASLAMTASLASNTPRAMTLASNPTAAQNDIIFLSQATVGGDHSNGTVLRAGQVHVQYRPI